MTRTCRSCGHQHQSSAQELVDGTQCKHCRAPFRSITEPFALTSKMALDALRFGLQVPVLVSVQTPGSTEHHSQQVQLERVARKLDGRGLVATIDADADRELAWELGITTTPTLLVLKRAHVIHAFEGVADAPLVEEWMRMAYRM